MSERVAMMQLFHLAQAIKSGSFSQFDFGHANMRIYKTMKPPKYPMRQVRIPVYLYAASEDWLVSPKVSVKYLIFLINKLTKQIFLNLNRM
jgi:hypothetical protein